MYIKENHNTSIIAYNYQNKRRKQHCVIFCSFSWVFLSKPSASKNSSAFVVGGAPLRTSGQEFRSASPLVSRWTRRGGPSGGPLARNQDPAAPHYLHSGRRGGSRAPMGTGGLQGDTRLLPRPRGGEQPGLPRPLVRSSQLTLGRGRPKLPIWHEAFSATVGPGEAQPVATPNGRSIPR